MRGFLVKIWVFWVMVGLLTGVFAQQESESKSEKVKILRKAPAKTQESQEQKEEEKKQEERRQEEEKKKLSLRRFTEKGETGPEIPPLEYGQHSFLVGPKVAMAISASARENADGYMLSPDAALRGEYVFRTNFMGVLDIGYNQGRFRVIEPEKYNPRQEAIIRADYLRTALLGGARYNLGQLKFPRFLANKQGLRKFYAYANLGLYFSYLFSTEIEVLSQFNTAGIYDYSPYANNFVWGIQTGLGFEMQIWKLMSFLEFSYARALSENFRNTVSLVFVTPATAEHSFLIHMGVKYMFFRM